MDRTAWIVVILCVIGLVLWEVYMAKQYRPQPVFSGQLSPQPSASVSATPAAPAATVAPVAPPPPETVPSFPEKIETLRNDDIELRLTNRGGGIKEAVLLKQLAERGQPVALNHGSHTPIGAIVDQPEKPVLPEFTFVPGQDGGVGLERKTPEGVRITKRFRFTDIQRKDNFILGLDIDFRNEGQRPVRRGDFFVALGTAQAVHARDWPIYTRLSWSVNGDVKYIDVNWFGGGGGFLGIGARAPEQIYSHPVINPEWVAVTNQFFTTLFAPLDVKPGSVWATRYEVRDMVPPPAKPVYGIEGAMGMAGFELAPGQQKSMHFELYVGPKIYHRLAELKHNEAGVVDFGAFLGLRIFKPVSQFLLNVLNLIHSAVPDYGFSILVLTCAVKALLWPIQNKANYSMRRMALLAPKMQQLREKYKDDPAKMNQEVMKLYKEYGINPVSGCLPMAIQIPIFFGLFSMLSQAVELRGATFLWVKDLSQPDTVGHLPVLGWPINVLPLLMAATNFWLMHMTPKTGDPTQRRMMMFMPLVFVIFCYNFAAALALYYTTQNLLTILQLWINQKQPPPTLEKVTVAHKRLRKAR
jgi:YidC/Oxa1 family membrane protein insertase